MVCELDFLDQVQSIYAESISILFNPVNQDIQSRIDEITERLQDIQTRSYFLGLSAPHVTQQQLTHQTSFPISRESSSLLCEREVYGRDDQKKEIIGRLLKDGQNYENYAVVPIVEQGGIGKTTLAQYVYNDDQVEAHFDWKARVCVSDVFDVKQISTIIVNSFSITRKSKSLDDLNQAQENLKIIINSATHQAGNFINLNQAQEKLKQLVTGKKFIIVLDDIWSDRYDDWNELQIAFRQGAQGSRVIVPTRIEKIARTMIKNPSHSTIINLEGLSDDDCWRLFVQHANEDPGLVEMRNDILRKCKGSPLAVKALGGLLRTTMEKSQRLKILGCNIWRQDSSVLPVLRLSYHHLPPHLKRIFAYGSIIPKDEEFAENIVLMWMAEGLLPESKDEKMEDISHDYFLDLVSRTLYEPSPFNEELFIMHDLIHDLAQWAAGDICCTTETMDMQRIPKRTRHLSFKEKVTFETLGRELKAPKEGCRLRTFACFDGGQIDGMSIELSEFIQRVRFIRIVVLAYVEIKVLPECVGDLKHLRHLDLSSTRVKELPESTSNLQIPDSSLIFVTLDSVEPLYRICR